MAQSDNGQHGLRNAGDDAFKLTVDYLRQETIDPLRGLGRFLYMGILGSVFLAGGILLVLIGVLRLLQSETGTTLTGHWSWVPYAVVIILGLGVVGVAVWRITAGPAKPKKPEVEARRDAAVQAGVSETTQATTRRVTTTPSTGTPTTTQEGAS